MSDWLPGTWTGTGSQALTGSSWGLRLTVRPQHAADTYQIDYPSLSCGGYWALQEVSRDAVSFTEHIVYGRDRCVDLGTITAGPLRDTPAGSQVAHMQWRWNGLLPDGRPEHAEALLTRHPP